MRVLVVEDDRLLGDALRVGLAQAGFAADWVHDGSAGLMALASEPFAAVVLDLGLPKLSGLDLLKRLRGAGNAVPVLILTARDAVPDRIAGLDAGADDYLVKPVDLGELAARLRALVRRSTGRAAPLLTGGPLDIDPAAHATRFRGDAVELSARAVARRPPRARAAGRVLSKEQLAERVYGWGEEVESNAVEVHV
ncbi:MAG: two component transcriptional regulator, winged helix family, partial [Deltaproteobacteria bacterium]|nr:two component transcriptional regulator, winged helix family [Deltaproteobacteria bacterium]